MNDSQDFKTARRTASAPRTGSVPVCAECGTPGVWNYRFKMYAQNCECTWDNCPDCGSEVPKGMMKNHECGD